MAPHTQCSARRCRIANSVVFFHHVEKTAGTTLRALFQRHAQLGLFDLISFVGRQNRLQLQLVLQRLHSLLRSGTLQGLRLAVELHVAGDLTFPYTLYYTMPDLVLIREQARDTLVRTARYILVIPAMRSPTIGALLTSRLR